MLKFRRQQPIDHYIVDFYCPEKRLIIEIDGGIHFTKEAQPYDEQRQQYLESQGFTVLRYTTAEVYRSLDRILDQVLGI